MLNFILQPTPTVYRFRNKTNLVILPNSQRPFLVIIEIHLKSQTSYYLEFHLLHNCKDEYICQTVNVIFSGINQTSQMLHSRQISVTWLPFSKCHFYKKTLSNFKTHAMTTSYNNFLMIYEYSYTFPSPYLVCTIFRGEQNQNYISER